MYNVIYRQSDGNTDCVIVRRTMYAYFKGILTEKYIESIVVEVENIGYNIKVSQGTAAVLPPIGEMVKIYTYTSVREDAIQLYGFLSKDDLDIFKLLINVNGIGPKGGQSILSVMSADELRFAIVSGDAKMIAKAPGIGAKTAQRVILDMKDKVSLEDAFAAEKESVQRGDAAPLSDAVREAVEALAALGYGSTEAVRAVKSVENASDLNVETLLKQALKYLI